MIPLNSSEMKGQALCQTLLVLFLLSGQILLASAGEEEAGEDEEVADVETQSVEQKSHASDLNDYKEEKNHSEAIQRILRDFEKTLVENKIMLDTSNEEVDEGVILDPLMNSTSTESNSTTSSNYSIESPGLEVVGVGGGNLTEAVENATVEVARVRMVCNNTMPETELRNEVMVHNTTVRATRQPS